MKYFLSIETSTEICSVCLHSEKDVINEISASNSYQHTKLLTVLIQSLFAESEIELDQLSAIAVSSGPGSYTGLRVGVATAKGLCYGLGIPLISINTLEALAHGTKLIYPNMDYYISMIDARRMEVYAQIFNCNLEECNNIEAIILDEKSFEQYIESSNIALSGNGVEKFQPLIPEKKLVYSNVLCNAAHMVNIVANKYMLNEFEDLSYFEPTYFKAPNITKSKKNILS